MEFLPTTDTLGCAIASALALTGALFFSAWRAHRWYWLLSFALAYGFGAVAFGLRGVLKIDEANAPFLQVIPVATALTLVMMGMTGATAASSTLHHWALRLSLLVATLGIGLSTINQLSVLTALCISAVYFIGYGILTLIAMRRAPLPGHSVVLITLGLHLGGVAATQFGWIEPLTAQNLGALPVAMLGLAMLFTRQLTLHRQTQPYAPDLCESCEVQTQLRELNHSLEEKITERTAHLKNYKKFLDDALQAIPDPTLICDALSNVVLANRAAARYFQVNTPSDLRERKASSLLKGLRTLAGDSIFGKLGLGIIAHEQNCIECNDGERSLLLRMTRLHDTVSITHDDEYVIIFTDISGLRQAQAERDEALRFITHDMRAPQASTLTLIELLRVNPEAIEPEEFIRRVENNARRTLQLAESFLLLSKAQEGEIHLSPCQLDSILYEVIDQAWSIAQACRIDIKLDRSDEGEVLADTALLHRALANLLDNAIKASPPNTEIVCQVVQSNDSWQIDVIDQGPGLAQHQVQALLKPFSRSPIGSRHNGFGLGLAFVSKVAQRHGGKLTIESTLGVGTRFSLILPLRAPCNP